MINLKTKSSGLFFLFFFLLALHCSLLTVSAQKRDSLTETEADLIREAQQIDLRMKIFVEVIDRRFKLLENPNATQTDKEEEKFGELPKGTKAQLLRDIERLLDESINNIDDTASHDLKNKLLPKAMKILVEGCQRYLPKLQILEEKSADKNEKVSLSGAIEHCGEIIEAQSKLPEPEPAKKKT